MVLQVPHILLFRFQNSTWYLVDFSTFIKYSIQRHYAQKYKLYLALLSFILTKLQILGEIVLVGTGSSHCWEV